MRLIFEVSPFFDPAVAVDCPDDAMFLVTARLPRALALAAVLESPLVVRGLVASLYSQAQRVRADFLPECFENFNGHPICGLPVGNCIFVSPGRLTFQHGFDQLDQSTVRVMHACKWHVFIVKNSAH